MSLSITEQYPRQKYIDGNADLVTADPDFIRANEDVTAFQLKYDGIWCLCHITAHMGIQYYSRNGNVKRTDIPQHAVTPGVYFGELMYGSQWSTDPSRQGLFYAFDCLEVVGEDLRSKPYSYRYKYLKSIQAPKNFHTVRNYPLEDLAAVWKSYVDLGDYEGVVLRNPVADYFLPITRIKPDIEVDLYVCRCYEGKPGTRLAGSLGAVGLAQEPHGQEVGRCGGGLSDALRSKMWANVDAYIGRCMTVSCKKIFLGGALRHANFVRWHEEK